MRLRTRATVGLIMRMFESRFRLARLTHVPVVRWMIDRAFFKGDDIIYLPRDGTVTIPVGREVAAENVVLPSEVVRRLIRASEHIFLMDLCICRTSNGCADYPRELGCIFLGRAVGRIDPSLGRRVSVEEALEHVDRCQEAGLVHMVGRNRIDSVWLDARPAEELMSICNCCECCCLWRMLPRLSEGIASNVHRLPGVEVSVDPEDCVGCGECLKACFVGALSLVDGTVRIDHGLCKGCGRCSERCPSGAISVTYDPDEIEKAVVRLRASVRID